VRTLVIATALAVARPVWPPWAVRLRPVFRGSSPSRQTQVTLGQTVTFDQAPLMVSFDTASLVDGLDGFGAVGTPEVYRTQ
jgi:hypothetical protein